MKSIDRASRVISGTFGQLWLDGELIAETSAFQAKVSKNKEDITICGQFMVDSKTMSGKGTGSVTVYHVDSGFLLREQDLQSGIDHRYTIVAALKDPDAWGAERIAVFGVSFDDLTLADWAAAKTGSVSMPFTFTSYQLLDTITPN